MPPRTRSFAYRMLLGNLKNKGIALFLAVVIWVFAFGNTAHTVIIDVRVKLTRADREQRITSITIAEGSFHGRPGDPFDGVVRLSVSGQRNQVMRLSRESASLQGIFEVQGDGQLRLDFTDAYGLPPGVKVDEANPSIIEVTTDREVTREMEIQFTHEGTPAPRFRFRSNAVEFEPRTVTVRGAEGVIDSVRVRTEPFDLGAMETSTVERTLALKIVGLPEEGLVDFAPEAPREVKVTVHLESALEQKSMSVRVVYGIPAEATIKVVDADESVTVSCSGSRGALRQWLERVESGEFSMWIPVQVDSDKIVVVKKTEFRWPDGALPDGIDPDSIEFEPKQVRYKVERAQE
ncbi:MAG: YbbR-like domain-containing protein [Planctomycetota bacterium]